MFEFRSEQVELDIHGVKFGGKPWRNPTVLIGTIFYEGHDIVTDWRKGIFDEENAKKKLEKLKSLHEETGNPVVLDIFGGTPESLIRYVDFVAENLDFPFLMDSADPKTLMATTKYVVETGLADRAVYNSLNYKTSQKEIEFLQEIRPNAVIVSATNIVNPTAEGRVEAVVGKDEELGLLKLARRIGFTKILIDVSMIDAPDVGPASEAIYRLKDLTGLPTGVGSTNFIELWMRGKRLDKRLRQICRAGGILFPVPLGADFILFGPVEWAEDIFNLCSLYNAFMGYAARLRGVNLPPGHPLTKVMA